MSTRTITSPGVEVRESDLSLIAPKNVGTNIFVTGFASQGPIDEVLKITSSQELDQIYGRPTNSAERYLYHTIEELLHSPANIYTVRIPYGESNGDGFGSKFSALVYPALTVTTDVSGSNENVSTSYTLADTLSTAKCSYVLGEPTHFELSRAEYQSIVDGTGFTWSSTANTSISTISDIGGAGLVVLNKSLTTINNQFEGYYVAIGDNTNNNPATDFNGIVGTKSLVATVSSTSDFTPLPQSTMQFHLSAEAIYGPTNSVSEVMEKLISFDSSGDDSADLLSIGVFKLRKSIFATEAFKLDYVLEDGIYGSINDFRTQVSPYGGVPFPISLEVADSKSRNVQLLVNPFIANRNSGEDALDVNGNTIKKVRVLTTALENPPAGVADVFEAATFTALKTSLNHADNLYSLGAYSDVKVTNKVIGDIPSKLKRALQGVENDEIYDIDVVCEAGLGTIYACASASATTYYDEYDTSVSLLSAVDGLRTSNEPTAEGRALRGDYSTIFNRFEQFCSPPYDGGGRGDCIFIADPIRHICVIGRNSKILDDKDKNFQQHVYWPMRHQFENENTSYACTYGNWAQVYDSFSGRPVWVPFSGFAGSAMANTDAMKFPWFAPAGFTRGLVKFANDIAISPSQKHRDEFYKVNINPVAFFPSQGQVIFGQKTMSRKPSAFDRINVRRLFQNLERPTKKACKYFVFEQNTEFTRTRIIHTLTPLFEYAKNNEGIYEYVIVCDERNNTPDIIDANELVVDIYIKPVRTAEFIRVNFYASRTDANFEELING